MTRMTHLTRGRSKGCIPWNKGRKYRNKPYRYGVGCNSSDHDYERWQRLFAFGISKPKFYEILEQQHNRCAVCRNEFKDEDDCTVDHNHVTKVFRGLVCRTCNSGMDGLKDNPELCRKAAAYLEAHQ